MKTRKPLLILASAAAIAGAAGGTAALAQSQSQSQSSIDGDADVHGSHLELEATTPLSTTRVTFLYGGRRLTGRLVETDREDREKDWEAGTTALRSDRGRNAVVEFRVRACSRSGCTTKRFQEREDD